MQSKEMSPEQQLELIEKIVYVNSLPCEKQDILAVSVISEITSIISDTKLRQEIQEIVRRFAESQQLSESTKLKEGVQLLIWPPINDPNPLKDV